MFLFAKVDLPPPPQSIINDGFERLKNRIPIMNDWGNDYGNRKLYHKDGEYRSSNNQIIYLGDEAHQWIKDNIGPEAIDIRIFSSTLGRRFTGAHTDRTRNYTMMYLIDGGGPFHKTVYYREKGRKKINYKSQCNIDDFTLLESLCEWQVPTNTWVILNSLVLHSVENIEQGRNSIQINLSAIPPTLKLKNCIHITNYS